MRRLFTAGARWRATLFALGVMTTLSFTAPATAQDDRFLASTWGETHSIAAAIGAPTDLVALARRYKGKRASQLGLPRSLWCADFVNKVRLEAGLRAVPSRLARDQINGGRRIAEPVSGAVVILSRGRGGGHTGFVAAVLPGGDIVVVSGNHGNRVAESTYRRSRVIAFVDPTT
jgi:uncharacterized protein (TIGR02594 family)